MKKVFSDYATEKIAAIIQDKANHVGSQLKLADPKKYENFQASDCITMAIWVLKFAFTQVGKPEAAKRVANLGFKGKVYESHWEKESGDGLYTNMPLDQFPWLSGVVIVPPDSQHLLSISTVKCG